jgi:phage repressor protein C with HTH and peptisase S24 domain
MPFTSNELEILSKKFGEAAPLNFPEQSGSNKKVDYIPEYDIRASAGGGSMSSEENIITNWPFSPEYIQNELRTSPEHLALIEVKGDSMEPTLSSGDRIMVNMADVNISQPGIFVIFDGDGTVIKRLERVYTSEEPTVALISDNEKHTRYEVLLNDRIKVVGRVIWAGKKM